MEDDMTPDERIKAWHFMAAKDGKPVLRDGNTVAAGYTYSVEGPLSMCHWGLHQSKKPLDALRYAPGHWIGYCEAWGGIEEQDDKFVARHREYLWVADAEATLRKFARLCALDVIDKWDAPDVVVRYLKTGDETIRDAAWAAAGAAARAAEAAAWAAWAAARAAAWAAWAAAWDAARAAEAAAWDAARAAARDAARAAQNDRLTKMLMELKP